MFFTDVVFLFYFLPLALLLHRISLCFGKAGQYHNISRLTLFGLTLVFYGYHEPWWLIPFFICIAFDFLWASLLSRTDEKSRRKILLFCSVTQNLFLLGLFKYWGTFLTVFEQCFPTCSGALPRFQTDGHFLSLPAGISFYTFESLSFVIDVYRREVKPPKNPLEFFAFIGMFPRFIAGPIVRYKYMTTQFEDYKGLRLEKGLYIFAVGLFFKICFADHFALFTRYAFDRADSIEFLSAWLGTFAYAMQLYFDFFGYTLMAIGMGHCLGFTFPPNFNRPYLASSVGDFWRRWHMTLAQWVRDYVYLPLALQVRKSRVLTLLALVLAMVLIGIWHGPRLTYFIMGIWFGVWLCLEQIFSLPDRLSRRQGRCLTFLVVLVGWVLLRAKDMHEATSVLGSMFNPFHAPLALNIERFTANPIATSFCLLGIIYCFFLEERADLLSLAERPVRIRTPVAVAMILGSLLFAYSEEMIPFLYFNF